MVSPSVPAVTLFGPGFLARGNIALGWSMTWRVGVANGLISGALHTAMVLARGDPLLDPVDQLLLFSATTIASLLVTDWAGRRLARVRYHLSIHRFIGFAIIWRESVASLTGGGIIGVLAVAGVALARILVTESLRGPLTVAWLVVLAPVTVAMALAGVGWSAHRVFLREGGRTTRLEERRSAAVPHASAADRSHPSQSHTAAGIGE